MNAEEELSNLVSEAASNIRCADIRFKDSDYQLQVGYNEAQKRSFINRLDFDYDNGYGDQMLFGTVWFEDGTWAERGEYNGSEWWSHRKVPEIPESLM